jgi:glycosyltransferase involved in cell wall biosynthesis
MNISILILTYNEELNLKGCLESVSFSDDVVVLDSESSDATVRIAKSFNATVQTRPFDNYAAQRNFGLSYTFKHKWILMLDADERVSDELAAELGSVITSDNSHSLYRLRRKDFFLGRWIKRASGYPTWFGRLVKKGEVWVERDINEEVFTKGRIGFLKEHLIHFPFNKGVHYWVERHNRYSSMEAKRLVAERTEAVPWKYALSKDPSLRRKFAKQILYRLPFRPFVVFLGLYFLKGGFLDGKAGFTFSCMRAQYEFLISIKTQELKRRGNGQEV